jgi:hypothetical protein
MVSGIKAKSYVERCEELWLDTLEKRRRLQDMVETFQILCNNNSGYVSGLLQRLSESQEQEQGKQQNH